MPAKGSQKECFSWYTKDVQKVTASMPAEMHGAWSDCITRTMSNKDCVGTAVATITTLSHKWGVPEDRCVLLLAEIATRVHEAQKLESKYTLFGFMTVDLELSAGVWTRLQMETVRTVIDAKIHPLTPVKIACPRVEYQAQERVRATVKKMNYRKSGDMGSMSPKKVDMDAMSLALRRDMGPCPEDIYPSNPSIIPPNPLTGELKNDLILTPQNTTTQIPVDRVPGDSSSQGKPDTGKNKETRKKARAGVEARKRLPATTTPEMDRVGSWFGHKAGTGWTMEESEAWRQLSGIVQPEDFEALEWYYGQGRKRHGARRYDRQTEDGFYLCRHKGTLLNKWTKQVAMALDRREKDRHAGSEDLRA